MRIAVDATTLRFPQTGIGYYTEHLLHHMLADSVGNDFILVSNRGIQTTLPLKGSFSVHRKDLFPLRSIWMQTLALRALRHTRPHAAHFTNSVCPLLAEVPTLVTIHDMSLTLYPQYHPWRRAWTRSLLVRSARRADLVIAVSQSTKRDIVRLTGIAAEKIRVIYEAAAPQFQRIRSKRVLEDVRRRYGLSCRFVLHVGTIEPRKNLERLVEAFRRVSSVDHTDLQLVLAGVPGWGYREVKRLIGTSRIEDRVSILGYVPYRDLPALYCAAEIFCFPSLYEGFGLPVIEAMACGTPVIAARNSSIEEIAGDAVEGIDADRTSSIESALRSLLADKVRREEVAVRGLAHSQRFSWKRAARETLDTYRSLVRS